jgi:hypothetical protein
MNAENLAFGLVGRLYNLFIAGYFWFDLLAK